MKWLILLSAGLIAIPGQAQNTASGVETNVNPIALQKVTVSGTVEVDEVQGTKVRVRTSPLNTKRVFTEFAASQGDYQLVLDLNPGGIVQLMPKSASSGLPTIQVAILTADQTLFDTKRNFNDAIAQISSNAAGNLFQGLNGAVWARLTFKNPITNNVLKKCTLSGVAVGKNQGGAPNTTALIRFKVMTTGEFSQKP